MHLTTTARMRRGILLCSALILFHSPVTANTEAPGWENHQDLENLTCSLPFGSLRVHHLPQPVVFQGFSHNASVTLRNGQTVKVATGSVHQINQANVSAASTLEFSVLPGTLSEKSVENLLRLLENYQYFDEDPDTVDGMPTYEIFVDSPDLYKTSTSKVRDVDPNFVPYRKQLRAKVQAILQPYLQTIITPYVQQFGACQNKSHDRVCTPCYSLIRRYRHGDRVSHATHHDGHAIVTVVVSLSDYDKDYRGGLYISTGFGQREFLALNKGDAVVHQSTLLHGVQVYDKVEHPEQTHRWSWILWYRDSTRCHDHSYEWFAECARTNPLCQQLHSTKVPAIPGIGSQEASDTIVELNEKAAQGGAGMAAVKIARAYLHQLPSKLPFDVQQAMHYFQLAIQSHNPDGHYGMAEILLKSVTVEQQQQKVNFANVYQDPRVIQAVQHLESAAKLHHAFSQFNLGMVHTYGYATNVINGTIAAEWFERSGLPEGYYVAAQQAKAVGKIERYQYLAERAQLLGFTAAWRRQARDATGSGGAAGVDLNLPWPAATDGRRPPKV